MKKVYVPLFFILGLILILPTSTQAFSLPRSDEKFLDHVQKKTFQYFVECTNPENGLVLDRANNFSSPDFKSVPGSIAGVGFALTAYPVGVERGWMTRDEAKRRTLATLKFFAEKAEHKMGFFYHFLDMTTGKRFEKCEISSVDTALLLAGVLFSERYFNDPQFTQLARTIFNRVDWEWMKNGSDFLCMGWKPEEGFLNNYWSHYAESLEMHILAMGSLTHGIDNTSWKKIKRVVGEYGDKKCIYCHSLFTHQYSHIWIDFRHKFDGFADYFTNSVQATLINRQFCLDSRESFKTFSEDCWGLTAAIGPDGYCAYGSQPGPATNDGTVAPTAAGASIVFTPELSIRVLKFLYRHYHQKMWGKYGFSDSFNLDRDFFAQDAYAINQGPILLMIENLRSEFIWKTFMQIPEVKIGMLKAGFKEVSLDSNEQKTLSAGLPVFRYKSYFLKQKPVVEVKKIADSLSFADLSLSSQHAEDIWRTAKKGIDLDQSFLQVGINLQSSYRCEARFLHNKDFLFVKLKVKDTQMVVKSPIEKMYQDDCIEIFLDSPADGLEWAGKNDFQIIISPDKDLRGLRVKEFFHHIQPQKIPCEFSRETGKPGSGYQAVLAIPKADFNLNSARVGFSLAAHNIDLEPESDAKFNWFFLEPGIHLGLLKFEGVNEN